MPTLEDYAIKTVCYRVLGQCTTFHRLSREHFVQREQDGNPIGFGWQRYVLTIKMTKPTRNKGRGEDRSFLDMRGCSFTLRNWDYSALVSQATSNVTNLSYPAQQESLATSLVKVSAANLSPSTCV